MDAIRSIRTFVRTLELGSLSAVAREQGTTQPTVSKIIAAYESELGVRLLERTTTSLKPTDQGRRFYARAKHLLAEYEEAVAEARGMTETPAGFLRISAPVGLGELRLNRVILEFLELYPDIELELVLNDRFVDLVEEEIDVAIRLGDRLPSNVIARKSAVSPRYLVAAPAYLARATPIRMPADLAHHRYIRYAWLMSGEVLELSRGAEQVTVAARGSYRVNSSLAILEAILNGAGLGAAPLWLIHEQLAAGNLVRVLPEWEGPPQEACLVYASRRYQPLRARVFLQFMADRLSHLPGFRPVGGALQAA